jgi:hypothetical protein
VLLRALSLALSLALSQREREQGGFLYFSLSLWERAGEGLRGCQYVT